MSTPSRTVVGLFAEGSRVTDPLRDWFDRLWQALAEHCGHSVDLKVFGISKAQIVALRADRLPARAGATKLIQGKGTTQNAGGAEPLDVLIARAVAQEGLARVIVAFDCWRPNQLLTDQERHRPLLARAEITFLLECFVQSIFLPTRLKMAARSLLDRYKTDGDLFPRPSASEPLEVILMCPMFESLFQSDEQTVLKALGFSSIPKDWPKFKTRKRAVDKWVIDRAVECKEGHRGRYLAAKSWWGYKIVKAASSGAKLWRHQIPSRLCRTLAS